MAVKRGLSAATGWHAMWQCAGMMVTVGMSEVLAGAALPAHCEHTRHQKLLCLNLLQVPQHKIAELLHFIQPLFDEGIFKFHRCLALVAFQQDCQYVL